MPDDSATQRALCHSNKEFVNQRSMSGQLLFDPSALHGLSRKGFTALGSGKWSMSYARASSQQRLQAILGACGNPLLCRQVLGPLQLEDVRRLQSQAQGFMCSARLEGHNILVRCGPPLNRQYSGHCCLLEVKNTDKAASSRIAPRPAVHRVPSPRRAARAAWCAGGHCPHSAHAPAALAVGHCIVQSAPPGLRLQTCHTGLAAPHFLPSRFASIVWLNL